MPLSLTLINNLSEPLPLDDLGITLPAGPGSIFDITGLFLPDELRQSDSLEEFVVLSGAVTISGTEGALTTAQAIRYFAGSQQGAQIFSVDGFDLRAMQDNAILAGDNIVVTSGVDQDGLPTFTVTAGPAVVADAIVGAGTVTVTSGTNQITVSGTSDDEESIIGGVFTIGFHTPGSAGDKFMSYSHEDPLSNEVSAPMPFNCRLIGINYSSKLSGTRGDIEIRKADAGNGSTNTTLFTWSMTTGRRVAIKTDLPSNLNINAGDKIAIFIKKTTPPGVEPDNPVVTLFFRITDDTEQEITENYGSNFS